MTDLRCTFNHILSNSKPQCASELSQLKETLFITLIYLPNSFDNNNIKNEHILTDTEMVVAI